MDALKLLARILVVSGELGLVHGVSNDNKSNAYTIRPEMKCRR